MYYGYFVDLKQHIRVFKDFYYGTRLPWILPGAFVYSLFPSSLGKVLLHFSFLYSAIISLYLILKRTLSAKVAFLTVLLVTGYQPFLNEMGSFYISSGAIVYFLLTLLMLIPSNEKMTRKRLFLAGCFASCLIFTQILFVPFLAFALMLFWFFNSPMSKQTFLQSIRLMCFGFFAMTFLFCVFNYLLTQNFFFFMPTIRWIGWFSIKLKENPWWQPFSKWGYRMPHLLIFCLIAALGFTVWMFKNQIKDLKLRRTILFLHGIFMLNLILMCFLQFFLKKHVLQYHYYSCYLYPICFLALGGIVAFTFQNVNGRKLVLHSFALVMITLLGLSLEKALGMQWICIFLIALFISAMVGFFNKQLKIIAVYAVAISFALINMERNEKVSQKYLGKNEAIYQAIVKGIDVVHRMDPEIKAHFWIPFTTLPSRFIFKSIASSNLFELRLFSKNFPHLDEFSKRGERRLILLSEDEDALEKANASLKTLGLKASVLREETVANSVCEFKILLLNVYYTHCDSRIGF